ncbi:MAG TPA: tetratricopeptide repeat protein [Gammaproteobacteria bacterium]
MSPRCAELVVHRCAPWIGVLAALLLAGCGASAPTRPDEAGAPAPAESVPGAAPEDVPEAAVRSHELAIAAMRRGDFTEAELELEQLMLAYPQLPGPYVNAAIVYRRDGRDADALAAIERALEIDPGHPEANNQLGILLRECGDFAGAEQAYRRALETRPDYPLALYNLGVLLDLYLRRPAEALALYERYQAVRPQPDETVALWIIDLRRRVEAEDAAARVAKEEGG